MRKFTPLLMIPAVIFILACGSGDVARYPETDGIPGNCELPDAVYYQPNIFPRFDLAANTLSLVDWYTGDTVRVLGEFEDVSYMSVLSWSPDCRYLMTHQRGDGVIWDTINGGVVGHFDRVPNFTHNSTSISWDETAQYVTIESEGSTLLFTLATGSIVPLSDHYFIRHYWDNVRNQLITVSEREVAAYDLATGAKVATFEGLTGDWRLVLSPDARMAAFYYGNGYQPDLHLHIFDRDTLAKATVFIGDYYDPGHIAFSPDNRYVAVGGFELAVWDLQNLPPLTDERAPAFRYDGPLAYIQTVTFTDSTTVEVSSRGGVVRYDIFTGETR
jgi:WD40 repeat protein